MDLRDLDYETEQLREMEADDEMACCRRCAEVHNEGSPADFECLECGEMACRLCAEDHARQAHPLPYEAEVAERVAADDRARTRFMIAVAFLAMVGVAVVLWPERERFFALYREPRVLLAMAILAGASVAIQIGGSLIGRRRPA